MLACRAVFRQQLPALIVTLLCLGLGYRVWSLEGEVAELEGAVAALQARVEPAPGTAAAPPRTEGQRAAAPVGEGLADPELVALGKELERLREQVNTLEEATADTATLEDVDKAAAEERILDVVDRKQSRIRAEQLAFQRDRWVGWRRQAFERFAKQTELGERQGAEVLALLEAEVDSIVELMQEPNAAEDPWKAANEWQALLDETDRQADAILEEGQKPAWVHARRVERQVLWPWLDAE